MPKTPIPLGTFLGLEHSAHLSAIISFPLVWLGLGLFGRYVLELPAAQAVTLSLSAAALHWLGEIWHQLGHARAARQAAAPMQGVRYWWVLGFSVYPADEPELSARVHIRRALGGPLASLAVLVLSGLLLLVLPPGKSPAYLLSAFVFLDHVLIYFGGAILPLGFTDGSTILRYWGKK